MKRLLLLFLFSVSLVGAGFAQPAITSTNPGSYGHTSNASFSITFNEAMDVSTINTSTIRVHGSHRGLYSGSISQSTNTFTFSPDSAFFPNEHITVTVTTGVENSSNVAMSAPYMFTYHKRPANSDGSWGTARSYTVKGAGNYAQKSVLADFNGDGALDIATITPGQKTVTIFLNNGDGTYGSGTDKIVSAIIDPLDVYAADIDNDGDVDLVTANGGVNNDHSLTVFKNDGTGNFADAVNYQNPGLRTAASLVAVDMNGNGFVDIVQSNSADDSLYVFMNSGTGTFNSVNSYPAADQIGSIIFVDVDQDKDMDIVGVDGTNNRFTTYLNDGNGVLSTGSNYTTGTGSVALAHAGFTGKPDIMAVNSLSDNVTLWKSQSGAPLFNSSNTTVGDEPYNLFLGDFTADGNFDAIVGNNVDQTISILTNSGSETFTQSTYSLAPTYANSLAFADVDGDGDLDMVSTNQNGTFSIIKNYSGGKVTSVTPANAAKNVAKSSNIEIKFDEGIDQTTLTSSTIKISGSMTGAIAGAFSYNSSDSTATFNPTSDFKYGEIIDVVVTTGVKNGLGVGLEKGKYSSFTVAPAASIGGSFAAKTDFTAGNGPRDVILFDIDGDSDLDALSLNYDADSLSVMLNNGSGVFGSPTFYYVGDQPTSFAVGDVTGDGNPDVVSVANESAFSVLSGNGDGTFNARVTKSTGAVATKISLGDIDNDGDLDVIYISGSQAKRQLNDGSGNFSDEWGFTSGSTNISVADLDNDGDLDFVYARDNAGISTLNVTLNNGVSSYSSSTYALNSSPGSVVTGDFNGDGYVDAVVTSNGKFSYYQNNKNGTFAAKVDFTTTNSGIPQDVVATDIDGDGDLDVLLAHTNNDAVVAFLNNGSGSFTEAGEFTTGDNPYALASADVNGDGTLDVVTANSIGDNISVLMGGTALAVSSVSPTANSLDVAANSNITITFSTDVTADSVNASNIRFFGTFTGEIAGVLSYDSGTKTATFNPTNDFEAGEVVTVSVSENVQTSVGIGLPARFYTMFSVAAGFEGSYDGPNALSTSSGGSAAKGARLADMDGDGDLDYVRLNTGSPGNVTILKNDGTGTFGSEVAYNLGGTAGSTRMELADVDLDGDLDAVVVASSNELHVLLNDGTGVLGTPTVYAFSANWLNFIEVGDITGDGYPDVLINTYGSGLVRFDNDGDGTFTAATNVSTTKDATMRVADVDGDGDLDILSGDWDNQNLQVLKNDGSGTFAAAVNYTATSSSNPYYMEVGDLDGDGDIDAVIANDDDRGGQTLSAMQNDGNGVFTKSSELNLGDDQPNNIQLFDIDGDGDLDVLAAFDGQGIGIYYNNGSGTFGNLFKPSTSGTYNDFFTDIAVGDINGDGDLDFIAVHNQPSYNYIYHNQTPTEPTEAAYDLAFSKNYGTQVTLSWENGDGEKRIVLAKQGGAVDGNPADQTNYTANAEFGSGSQIGSGNYVVYSGSGSTVDVTGLSLNTAYHFSVIEYNGSSGFENYYLTSPGTGNVTTNEVAGIGLPEAGSAISFSGSGNSYLRMSMDTLPSAAFTIETWVKPGATGSDQVIASYGRNDEFVVGINASNQFYASHVNTDPNASSGEGEGEGEFKIRNQNSPEIQATATVTGTSTISANQWYHVAVTAEKNGNLVLFVNGTQESSTGLSFVQIDQSYWYPGSDYDETKLLTGVIDEMRMWSVARSVSEIRDQMYRTYQGFGENMLGYWQFNEGTGSTAADRLGNYNANVYDGASWTTSDAPIGNGSSNSVSSITSGSNSVGNATIELTDAFDSSIDVQVTEVEDAPNSYPSGYTSGIGGKYFVINLFGDPGTFSANITLTFGSGVVTSSLESDPSTLKLYKRSSNATGTWTSIGGATTAVASTGAVTWTGITSFSQFMAVEGDPYDLIQLADNSDVTAYDDSVFVFGSTFFSLNDNYADSALTISSNTTLTGKLFIDKNANNSFDSGTDSELTSGTEFTYTPSGTEKLIYSSSTLGYESATITLKSANYTDSVPLDLLTVDGSPSLSGTDNEDDWKLITNPFTTTIGTLLDSIWTQGAINSKAPNGDATIYTYSSETSTFSAVTSDLDTTKVRPGQGLAVYMFAFNDYAVGIPANGGWPKNLRNYGTPHGNSVNLTLKNTDHDGTVGTSGDEGWVLVGNPFGWALSADSVIASIKRDDPAANNNLYRWNAVSDQYDFFSTGAVQPYEAVFARIETSGTTANITLDEDDRHTGGSKQVLEQLFALKLTHPESDLSSDFYLDINEDRSVGIDPHDAYYRGSLASKFAHLYARVDDQRLILNALPKELTEELEIPLHIDASVSGTFSMNWNNELIPEGWEMKLRDEISGEMIPLNSEEMFSFKVEDQQQKQKKELPFASALTASADEKPRFSLIVRSDLITSLEEEAGIPTEVELYQNYPNPFNPATVIKFGVPEVTTVRLEVFDVLGRRIHILMNNETKQAGRYTVPFNAQSLASGIYFYRLTAGNKVMMNQMTLIK